MLAVVRWFGLIFRSGDSSHHVGRELGGLRTISAPQVARLATILLQWDIHSISRFERPEQFPVELFERLLLRRGADDVFCFMRVLLKVVEIVRVPYPVVVNIFV